MASADSDCVLRIWEGRSARGERGIALPMAIVVTVVCLVIASGLAQYMVSEIRACSMNYDRVQALYCAEAGVEKAVELLRNAPGTTAIGETALSVDVPATQSVSAAVGTYEVTIEALQNNGTNDPLGARKVTSRGYVPNKAAGGPSRTLVAIYVPTSGGYPVGTSICATGMSNGRTQPINKKRSDGNRYALISTANNVYYGLDEDGDQVGTVSTGQNFYLTCNNAYGRAQYGDPFFPNVATGNHVADEIRNAALGPGPNFTLIDPEYYRQQAQNTGTMYGTQTITANNITLPDIQFNGNLTISGNNVRIGKVYGTGNLTVNCNNATLSGHYYVSGNITMSGNNINGCATLAAGHKITLNANNIRLTPADTQDHVTYYAGCDAAIGGASYFQSSSFNANDYYIQINDNNFGSNGTVYSPYGYTKLTANNIAITASLIADSVGITGNNIDLRYGGDYTPRPAASAGISSYSAQ